MFVRALLIAAIAFTVGCEKTDHENIERWMHTAKGPAKLRQALSDGAIDPDLSAHAAAGLIKRGDDQAAWTALSTMAPARRAQVVGRLAPRLWEIARLENDTDLPGALQVVAKDALVRIRPWADDAGRQQIDGYLIDWYCVASFEDRAKAGANLGPAVMRLVGPAAARKLMTVANGVIAAPGQGKTRNAIGSNLLLGLAATGSPDAVKYVLDIARMDRGDPTLARRAMSALYVAYVEPNGEFPVTDRQALLPDLPAIVEVAKDDAQDPRAANDAVALIRAVGAPHCLAPLVGMIGAPHRNAQFKFVIANNALKCGGTQAILEVVRALPDAGAYAKDQVTGGISGEIARMTPRDQAQAQARALLAETSTVARWVGMEALTAMKSTDDAPAIAALGTSRERLVGYWGEHAEGKEDPTLGQRARELSAVLRGK
ncbi:MAG TPA: hypothetical protein VFT22_09165 [Kofleriaceae bacterium]|nr:hypothetical protein [Kofleriaceae bacterium]